LKKFKNHKNFKKSRGDTSAIHVSIIGYGWLMRTLVKNSGMTKEFEKSGATFNYKILTPTKDVIWNGIHFGQPYVGEYLDDSKHQVYKFSAKRKTIYTFCHAKNSSPMVKWHDSHFALKRLIVRSHKGENF
jgi:hypothetical protein